MARRNISDKTLACACAILALISLGTVSGMVLAVAPLNVSYPDPKDDLRCFTKKQIEEFSGDYNDPGEFLIAIRSFWSQGKLSSEPNCIDVIWIRFKQVGMTINLTIVVEGNVTDCDNVIVMIWGNCTDGSGIAGTAFVQATSGGPTESYYVFVDADGNPLSNGTAGVDGGSIEMSFPASAWGNESCSLYVMMVTVSGTGENQIMCADIYPNSVVGEPTGNELGANALSDAWAALYYWFAVNWWWLLIVLVAIIGATVAYYYLRKTNTPIASKRVVKSAPSKKRKK